VIRADLEDAVVDALNALGGTGSIPKVAEQIWIAREVDLRSSGELFFTWQYDIRWAAQRLQDAGKLEKVKRAGKSVWELR
jgi:hypothetical protein